MSDDVATLRRAAKLVRETAEAATKGRWRVERDEHGEYLMVLVGTGQVTAWDYAKLSQESLDLDDVQPNANHIALFDPTVALAVADWLTVIADRAESIASGAPRTVAATAVARIYGGGNALVVAKAILREES